jgi:LacI family transcriptional regulator, galactose operon repressor
VLFSVHNKNIKRTRQKPTLRTIAEIVGVNPSTISRVLNEKDLKGDFSISPERREQILEVCESLNYRPSPLGRAVKSQKTMTICACGYLGSPYFYNMLLPAQSAACKQGFTISVHGCDDYDSVEEAIKTMFSVWHYDGVWSVGSTPDFQKKLVEYCHKFETPLVIIGQPLGCEGAYDTACVYADLDAVNAELAEYVCTFGHRKFVLFAGSMAKIELTRVYYNSLVKALKKYRVSPDDIIFVDSVDDPGEACEIAYKYFKALKKTPRDTWPTAAIVASNTMGTLHGMEKAGIAIPMDMSIVAIDNTIEYVADHLRCGISAIYEPCGLFGEKSMKLLLDMIRRSEQEQLPYTACHLNRILRKNSSCIPVKDMNR